MKDVYCLHNFIKKSWKRLEGSTRLYMKSIITFCCYQHVNKHIKESMNKFKVTSTKNKASPLCGCRGKEVGAGKGAFWEFSEAVWGQSSVQKWQIKGTSISWFKKVWNHQKNMNFLCVCREQVAGTNRANLELNLALIPCVYVGLGRSKAIG